MDSVLNEDQKQALREFNERLASSQSVSKVAWTGMGALFRTRNNALRFSHGTSKHANISGAKRQPTKGEEQAVPHLESGRSSELAYGQSIRCQKSSTPGAGFMDMVAPRRAGSGTTMAPAVPARTSL